MKTQFPEPKPERLYGTPLLLYRKLVKDYNVAFPIGAVDLAHWRNVGKVTVKAFLDCGLIRYNDEDKKDAKDQIKLALKHIAKLEACIEKQKLKIKEYEHILEDVYD